MRDHIAYKDSVCSFCYCRGRRGLNYSGYEGIKDQGDEGGLELL